MPSLNTDLTIAWDLSVCRGTPVTRRLRISRRTLTPVYTRIGLARLRRTIRLPWPAANNKRTCWLLVLLLVSWGNERLVNPISSHRAEQFGALRRMKEGYGRTYGAQGRDRTTDTAIFRLIF
jgi:hypothetical protein